MNEEKAIGTDLTNVTAYYKECWLNRFSSGHNPLSQAMHLGYFSESHLSNDEAKLNMNEFLIDKLGITRSEEVKIADFGCGIGSTCLYLAKRLNKSKIFGVNISQDQIDFANQNKALESFPQDRIEYMHANYSETNLPSNSFDAVFGLESICHANNKANVFNEGFRILKSGGIFGLLDYFETRKPENGNEERLLNEFRNGWAVQEYISNHRSLLDEAGLTVISDESVLGKVRQGIEYSYEKASNKLSGVESSTLSDMATKHFKACLALKLLTEAKLIDYRIVVARKN